MILERGADFIWRSARLLERAVFDYRFLGGPAQRVVDVIASYQRDDGGLGHALEPDVRAPGSQPVFAEFALHTLYECDIRAPQIAERVCDFLAAHADLQLGIAPLLPSARQYPRAAHWHTPYADQPSLDRLAGLVGLAHWHGAQHPWLAPALDACYAHVARAANDDSHTILTAFCLLESLAPTRDVRALRDKLARDLRHASSFNADAAATEYGLTPLTFAPTPDAYCRDLFSDAHLDAHLDALAAQQQEDGGWPLAWEPPSEAAVHEWRGHRTVGALWTLRAYRRI